MLLFYKMKMAQSLIGSITKQTGGLMKHTFLLLATITSLIFSSCDQSVNRPDPDLYAPFSPVGIVSTSLDHGVLLKWIENQEADLDGYNVYVSNAYRGKYTLIGTTRKNSFLDAGAHNGETYYYAVTAFDKSGNESELSFDVVYDTPRPEGAGVSIMDRISDPLRGGYDFSQFSVVHYDTDQTDLYCEASSTGIPYIVVWRDSDIQDMGYTADLDEISQAPAAGWSPTKDAHAISGHTYVIRTYDNHYAKVRLTTASKTGITFDWAYQTAVGNPELVRTAPDFRSKRIRK
jgi:hypothetical protein